MIAIKMNYADWVYIGKESYDSRQVTRYSLKPGTNKFFDALGRVYSKMKAQIKYYVFKDAIDKNEYEVTKEFDVWARIIKDSDGNDVHLFVKEDKAHGLRKDSSFYWDGRWEVFERDSLARTVKSRTSLGIKTITEYDAAWHINKYYLIDNINDTITAEQYIWKNGRLVKMIQNGLERIYTYGKTLQDIVKVTPSDEGIYFHQGYNNSVGKIPDENDPMYKYFARDPYGGYGKSLENNLSLNKETSVLFRNNAVHEVEYSRDFPIPWYYNPPFMAGLNIKRIYPNDSANGIANFSLYLDLKCKDDGCGNFYIDDVPKIGDESITLYESFLVYEQQEWRRYCRTENRINATHDHEIKHLNNAKNAAKKYGFAFIPMRSFSTKKECETEMLRAESIIFAFWTYWKKMEHLHNNIESPQPTPFILERICKLELYL